MKKYWLAAAILAMSVGAYAQFGGRFAFDGGPGGRACLVPGGGPEDRSRKIDESGFVYARLRYEPQPWWRRSGNPEVPWHHDYPDGDTMLPTALKRLTTVNTAPESFKIVDI